MIYVLATIETEAGQRAAVLEEFAKIVPLVLQEVGCVAYAPTVDLETNIGAQVPLRGDVVTVVEQWENVDALEAHLMAPHMMEFRAAVKDLVRSVALQIVEPT